MLKYLLCFLRHQIKINLFKLDETALSLFTNLFDQWLRKQALFLMEISDEEGEQIDGGKRSYVRGDAASCSKQLSQSTRKKSKFHGNQFTLGKAKVSKTTEPPSHKKVKRVRNLSTKKQIEGYRLVDMDIFSNIINC